MSVVVVVGAQWGDEGKGKIVDLLTERADLVVRFGGGSNAGHTLVVDGRKYVTHLVPSGVLRRGVRCVLGEGMAIDPRVLWDEIQAFRADGLLARDEDLVVAERAHVTLPFHLQLDALREERPGGIGTTRRGVGPTYESKAARVGIRMGDLIRPERFRRRLARAIEAVAPALGQMGAAAPDAAEIERDALRLGEHLAPFIADASLVVDRAIRSGRNVLFEGAHGVLLDLDHGTYPFVTSSSTTAGGACTGCGVGPTRIDRVLGIAKAYVTRVGLGPFPTELVDGLGERLRQRGAEFGSTTGRPRRCGWLDVPALRLAIRLSGMDGLALTKLDVLGGIEGLRLGVAYRVRGRSVDELPLDADDLEVAEPVYEEHAGWEARQGQGALRGGELPEAARRYVARVSELCGVPVWITSMGPGRAETEVAVDPFAV